MNEVVILIPVFEGVNNLRRGYASAHPQFEPQLGNSFFFGQHLGIHSGSKTRGFSEIWPNQDPPVNIVMDHSDPILQLTQLINNDNDGHKVKPASRQAPDDESDR